jgi:hypothetical protein
MYWSLALARDCSDCTTSTLSVTPAAKRSRHISAVSQQLDGIPVGGIFALFVSERWSEDIGREAGSFVESNATNTFGTRGRDHNSRTGVEGDIGLNLASSYVLAPTAPNLAQRPWLQAAEKT